jgi:TATA-box binding protein (TBP) (component of TFIID and TFIIIB)
MNFSQTFDLDMMKSLEKIDQIRKQVISDIIMGDLMVSNMTLFFESYQPIDIELLDETIIINIENSFKNENISFDEIKLSGTRNTKSSSFRNARILTIKLNKESSRCCLIFKNGGIQIKGLRSATEGLTLSNVVFQAIHGSKNIKTHNIDVHLINSRFALKDTHIDLDLLHQYLIRDNRIATLNRERHSAVNLTINYRNEKNITALFFRKGNVIITGASTPLHLLSAYAFVADFLSKHTDCVQPGFNEQKIKVPKRRGRKRKSEIEEKYEHLDI